MGCHVCKRPSHDIEVFTDSLGSKWRVEHFGLAAEDLILHKRFGGQLRSFWPESSHEGFLDQREWHPPNGARDPFTISDTFQVEFLDGILRGVISKGLHFNY